MRVNAHKQHHEIKVLYIPAELLSASQVRAVIGQTYMLTQDEELWEKELPANVETLLSQSLADRSLRGGNIAQAERDKTRVVSYRVPHNAAVQVYDYREKKARYVVVTVKWLRNIFPKTFGSIF